MSKGLIIFDFDGTLGDTRRNIVTTMQGATFIIDRIEDLIEIVNR